MAFGAWPASKSLARSTLPALPARTALCCTAEWTLTIPLVQEMAYWFACTCSHHASPSRCRPSGTSGPVCPATSCIHPNRHVFFNCQASTLIQPPPTLQRSRPCTGERPSLAECQIQSGRPVFVHHLTLFGVRWLAAKTGSPFAETRLPRAMLWG